MGHIGKDPEEDQGPRLEAVGAGAKMQKAECLELDATSLVIQSMMVNP